MLLLSLFLLLGGNHHHYLKELWLVIVGTTLAMSGPPVCDGCETLLDVRKEMKVIIKIVMRTPNLPLLAVFL